MPRRKSMSSIEAEICTLKRGFLRLRSDMRSSVKSSRNDSRNGM